MNTMKLGNNTFYAPIKIAGIMVIPLLAITIFSANNALALEVDCAIPNSIVCDVSDSQGFIAVRVSADFGELGTIDVVDNLFPTCRTTARVSWDQIVPNFQIHTTQCSAGGFKLISGDIGRPPRSVTRTFQMATRSSGQPASELIWALPENEATEKFELQVVKLTDPNGGFASVKFCDNHRVDDDIVSCDIDEIAWVCPDGASGPSEDCEANVHGEFDD